MKRVPEKVRLVPDVETVELEVKPLTARDRIAHPGLPSWHTHGVYWEGLCMFTFDAVEYSATEFRSLVETEMACEFQYPFDVKFK